jgi:hypothetical protein
MDIVFVVVFRILEAMFVIGLVGCLFVIPSTAYMMFKVLVGRDHDLEEEQPVQPLARQAR